MAVVWVVFVGFVGVGQPTLLSLPWYASQEQCERDGLPMFQSLLGGGRGPVFITCAREWRRVDLD